LDVTPNAVHFVKAIRGCKDTIALSMTAGGRLTVKSGNFKAFVDCYTGGFPEIIPTGERMELSPDFMEGLKVLEPCVADDASRQWARGILFRGKSMFATNNVVLAEYWLGADFPLEMNLPLEAVKELIRIGEAPSALLAEENAVTFLFSGDRWMRSQLYTTQWPDLAKVLDKPSKQAPVPLTVGHLEELMPFADDGGRVYLLDNMLATSLEEGLGARLEIAGLPEGGIYNVEMLILALALADTIDLTSYPAPCHFAGKNLRGAIIGMRV
jgi:hypothetical protein